MVTFSSRRFLALTSAAFFFVLLLAFFSFGFFSEQIDRPMDHRSEAMPSSHRKLLQAAAEPAAAETSRIGNGCSMDDILVYQGATAPLPNGIPTYTVHILNVCLSGCSMANIHVSCGWFASARLINPRIFRRLRYNDCLVNDGRPLAPGTSLSFQYANSFSYPLYLSSAACSPN